MTVINVRVRNSISQPFTGFVRVTLDHPIEDDDTNYLAVPADVPLVSGLATVTLEPSEIARTTYKFEIFKTTDVIVEDENGDPVSKTVTDVVYTIHARVPDSLTPIDLADLAPSGITHDAMDQGAANVARRLYYLDNFWSALRNSLFGLKGVWNAVAFYRQGDIVFYDGGTYCFTSTTPQAGVLPTDNTKWVQWSSRGIPGSGTTGVDAPYSPAWNGSTDAPSRNSLYDLIETLATKAELDGLLTDSELTRPILASAIPPLTDDSSKIVSTAWIQDALDIIRKKICPVGMLGQFALTSAPTGWVICDGRVLSRAVYAELFAVLGTAYDTGGETVSEFRVPDLRGRVIAGLDQMSVSTGQANRLSDWALVLGANNGGENKLITTANLPATTLTSDPGNTSAPITGGGTVNTAGTAVNAPFNVLQPTQVALICIFANI